jgi:3-phosphoshikimate 1-carboxyvinyltransferase
VEPQIAIRPAGPLDATIRPPGSKSITNRALACAALAEGPSLLCGALDSEDTRLMVDCLRGLGIAVEHDTAAATMRVAGQGGRIPASSADLFVGNSGTTVRFLAALVALGHGKYRLDGAPRMRQRPIGDLLEGLRQLGASAASEPGTGCPPVIVEARGLPGGRATVRGDVSSQFLSGLLIAAPYAAQPVELSVAGPLVSQPYVRMTLAVMRAFGVEAAADERLTRFAVPTGRYAGRAFDVEPDASAASYFLAAAAIAGGRVTVEGLARSSVQGDVALADVLEQMGCRVTWTADRVSVEGRPLRGLDVDMNAISDTVQTLAAVALFAEGPTTIAGVGHIRHKETDRLAALATELRKLGADVDELPDGLRIHPAPLAGARLATYDDHRMAMSLALVGLRVPGVVILDPGCTAKTYPNYFADLERVCRGSQPAS